MPFVVQGYIVLKFLDKTNGAKIFNKQNIKILNKPHVEFKDFKELKFLESYGHRKKSRLFGFILKANFEPN
jgi:hypothetical protein